MEVLNSTRGLGGRGEFCETWRGGPAIKLGVLNPRGASLELSVFGFAPRRVASPLSVPLPFGLDDGTRIIEYKNPQTHLNELKPLVSNLFVLEKFSTQLHLTGGLF